jgi:signal transduction histidine kinase
VASKVNRLHTTIRPSSAVIRFASLVLVFITMIAVGGIAYFTQRGIEASRDQVVHSYRVRAELSDLQLEIVHAEAVESRNNTPEGKHHVPPPVAEFDLAAQQIEQLHRLTADDPHQQALVDQSGQILTASRASSGSKGNGQAAVARTRQQAAERHKKMDAIVRTLQDREESLLEQRLHDWDYLFKRNALMLGFAFAVIGIMLAYNFSDLLAEVKQTKDTERRVRENADSFRLMSAKILELQDFERRRIARELHDSVGQYLAGLKINLSQMKPGGRVDPAVLVNETIALTDCALQEVRTISHLLHPPLLDELGFLSAARWYVDEYGKRSQVKVALTVDGPMERLPREVEIALFRVLQESLTNVYRHAAARSVDVRLTCRKERVTLTIADDGKGIPLEILSQFHDGSAPGIGLGGMRERLAEFGGIINVQSSSGGSVVQAIIPSHPDVNAFHGAHAAD